MVQNERREHRPERRSGTGNTNGRERSDTGFKDSGFHVFATKEYMSRVRGGNNTTEIRVSSRRVRSFVDRIDVLIPLGKGPQKG